jgi:hypothetical protein
MAQYDEDDFDFDTEEVSGTDLVKKLRKQVTDLSKALKERDSQLEDYFSMSREQEIAAALQDMGVNPKIAKFIPDDVEDSDDLEQWLAEYGDVFGVGAVEEAGSYTDAESISAAELMSEIEEGGIDPQVGMDLAARIASASTPDELTALLRG